MKKKVEFIMFVVTLIFIQRIFYEHGQFSMSALIVYSTSTYKTQLFFPRWFITTSSDVIRNGLIKPVSP